MNPENAMKSKGSRDILNEYNLVCSGNFCGKSQGISGNLGREIMGACTSTQRELKHSSSKINISTKPTKETGYFQLLARFIVNGFFRNKNEAWKLNIPSEINDIIIIKWISDGYKKSWPSKHGSYHQGYGLAMNGKLMRP